MKPAQTAQPFFDKVMTGYGSGDSMPAGRWAGITYETIVARPANGRPSGDQQAVSFSAVAAVRRLVEGDPVSFVNRDGPALTITTARLAAKEESCVYRFAGQCITSGLLPQSPVFASLFAARLLLSGAAPDFSAAYGDLLDGLAQGLPDADLQEKMLHASDELLFSLASDGSLDYMSWWREGAGDDVPELTEASAVDLRPLFTDPVIFRAWLDNKSTPFDGLRAFTPGAAATNTTVALPSADTFIGRQLDVAVRFMKTGKHVLHHGPTGTGKSTVWEKAMLAIEPDFDPDRYPYFVHGSGGLEDIDFTGNYVLRPTGEREWVNGPLVQAMLDGRRFKVEEPNRMSPSMLNVLIGAMDFGRITLTRYDGRIIRAADGFAVDAMVNLGQEYTGTEELDPAILRRFQRKIEYDFLKPEDEVTLLRSRYPALAPNDAITLVKIANTIREDYAAATSGGIADLYVSPAALLHSAELVSEGTAIEEAIEVTWLLEVAKTPAKREAIREANRSHIRVAGGQQKKATKR